MCTCVCVCVCVWGGGGGGVIYFNDLLIYIVMGWKQKGARDAEAYI